jgi:hypothetical protein
MYKVRDCAVFQHKKRALFTCKPRTLATPAENSFVGLIKNCLMIVLEKNTVSLSEEIDKTSVTTI